VAAGPQTDGVRSITNPSLQPTPTGSQSPKHTASPLQQPPAVSSKPLRPPHGIPLPGVSASAPSARQQLSDASVANSNGSALTRQEARAQGVVSTDVLLAYARALGGVPVLLQLVLLYVLIEFARVGASVWLSVWTEHSGSQSETAGRRVLESVADLFTGRHHTAHPLGQPHTTTFYLAIFCAISGAQVCSVFLGIYI
jgi:hypothetical protein